MNLAHIARSSITVFLFEWNRSMTASRVACWSVLVLFPPLIFGILAFNDLHPPTDQVWDITLYGMSPGVITMLGLLLWATPSVHTELEGKTWIYLAVRPAGKDAVLIGKYLSAVGWSAVAAWLGMTLSVAIISIAAGHQNPLRLWFVLSVILFLSAMAYGALFSFIGVLFKRRAMVVAVAYSIIFELIVAFLPAIINKFTVQYRLASLMFQWMDWGAIPQQSPIGREPPWQHILILFAYTVGLMTVSALFLRLREHITSDET